MKTMKYISLRVLAIAALALAFAMPAKAQLSEYELRRRLLCDS